MESSGGVQSVERAFDLLEIMAGAGGSVGVSELAEAAELPMPTIHRLLKTLVALGYARRLPSRRYALGTRLIALGERSAKLIGSWARPYLAELVSITHETSNMAFLEDDMAVYVAQVPSEHAMRMFNEVGQRVFPHSTGVGKALLAQLPDEEVLALLARTGMAPKTVNTHTTPAALLADLAVIRERGYSVDEGEQEVGVRCFAVPVIGAPTLTAISIAGPSARVTPDTANDYVPLLVSAAERLAKDLAADGLGRR
ncbi:MULTISPECIES: IclR family transcriptional regulator [unclassified Rhodococcus (in: high G+C Gram-positive bacteria)]|jgi:IclR family acetate operon transcriptional repressor|uniref:IclR family transcriptional regulator n=1 Tax=unclassified Rhodococcus (in: high G+C Gram-positive bacteria) TaxID=192944 RepID=UPI000489F347|nr:MULTISPECIES: IclR family transcriptional regulator [unclassified Rhodococcus (in: high G+C Gram-positive bacteria)]MBY6675834.1 IclR family transcriptional regulator [Rhodococcus sp. BP-332]MBY6679958.1 IclR family transcriptional regulator [Rhodococcus sp. BP-316]MBY6705703.1 IclR family transcriptional regulator [Rhodococcus sp. BP-241]MDQ1180029.1 IclR family acetate operon transcriptional repressor [Rhodococcus sp. SORGH_AS_0301]MDQ1201352.1 IclR family acetate operon transcriptional r